MELIEIGKTKLIFLLEQKDMEKYEITIDEYSPTQKNGFLRLVSDTGVDTTFLSDVLVEIFEAKDGGCEMFVTKLSDKTDSAYIKVGCKKYIYSFLELYDLMAACRMLMGLNLSGGEAYVDRDRRVFYLALENEYKHLTEFGASKCKSIAWEYLCEHCSLFAKDAIEKLSCLT